MKKFRLLFITILTISVTVAWSQKTQDPVSAMAQSIPDSKTMSSEMFLENESKFGFDETVAEFKMGVENRSWKVVATHDLQQTMKKHGNDVLPVTVLALCHPKHSAKILELEDERIISPMMPCRVSIYNKSDGKTYISRMNSIAMAQNFDGVIKEVMTDSALEVEEMIRELIIEK